MSKTMIEYADAVWNPITGCTKVSDGCKNCWAERFSPRLKIDFNKVSVHQDRIDNPKFPRRPSRIFVCSMSDLFHEQVSFTDVNKIFGVIGRSLHHKFLILTKRPARMMEFFNAKEMLYPNVWLGVSVEDQKTANERIPILLQTPAALRFISAEPLLGEIDLTRWIKNWGNVIYANCDYPTTTNKIDWVITGGESGPKARPSHPDWFRSLRDQCQKAEIPFYFKQWGKWIGSGCNSFTDETDKAMARRGKRLKTHNWPDGHYQSFLCGKKAAGNYLDGKTHNELPGECNPYEYLNANGV